MKALRNWSRKASICSSGADGLGRSPFCQCHEAMWRNTEGSWAMIEIGTEWVGAFGLTKVAGWWSPSMIMTKFGSFSLTTHDVRAWRAYWIDCP